MSQYKALDPHSPHQLAPLSLRTMLPSSRTTYTSYPIPMSFSPQGQWPPTQCTQDYHHQHTKRTKTHKATTVPVPPCQNQSNNWGYCQKEIGSATSKGLNPPSTISSQAWEGEKWLPHSSGSTLSPTCPKSSLLEATTANNTQGHYGPKQTHTLEGFSHKKKPTPSTLMKHSPQWWTMQSTKNETPHYAPKSRGTTSHTNMPAQSPMSYKAQKGVSWHPVGRIWLP